VTVGLAFVGAYPLVVELLSSVAITAITADAPLY
jgi:hypothetical protein